MAPRFRNASMSRSNARFTRGDRWVPGDAASSGPARDQAGRKIRASRAASSRDRLALVRAYLAPRTEERRMSVFTVDLQNQPGELARLCEAMAGHGVNLILCATTRGEDGTVAFIADDEASAEAALGDAGIGYARRPALTIRMENQPGAGAATFRKLAGAGVNADLLVPVRVSDDLFFAVICVDDPDKARRALGVQVISKDDFVL